MPPEIAYPFDFADSCISPRLRSRNTPYRVASDLRDVSNSGNTPISPIGIRLPDVMLKSGDYAMLFHCDGYRGRGTLSVSGQDARGIDDRYVVEGRIASAGSHLIGAFRIDLAPGVSGNARISGRFGCAMNGDMDDEGFRLYGVGPLGLIIEIECRWLAV